MSDLESFVQTVAKRYLDGDEIPVWTRSVPGSGTGVTLSVPPAKRLVKLIRRAIVPEPIRFTVECRGERREITVSPTGAVRLDHSPEELNALEALSVLGETCSCLRVLDAFRLGHPSAITRMDPYIESRACRLNAMILLNGDLRDLRLMYRANSVNLATEYIHRVCSLIREQLSNVNGPDLTVRWNVVGDRSQPKTDLVRRTHLMLTDSELGAMMAGLKWLRKHRRLGSGTHVLIVTPGLDLMRRYRERRHLVYDRRRNKSFLVIDEYPSPKTRTCLILDPARDIADLRQVLRVVTVDRRNNIIGYMKPRSWGIPASREYTAGEQKEVLND